MKKIVVDENACIGCGACVAIDSEHFEFNDTGLSKVINNENLESKNLLEAIDSCPTSAIHIEECDCDEHCACEADACGCDNCGCDHCECEDCSCEECDCDEDNCHCDSCSSHQEEK